MTDQMLHDEQRQAYACCRELFAITGQVTYDGLVREVRRMQEMHADSSFLFPTSAGLQMTGEMRRMKQLADTRERENLLLQKEIKELEGVLRAALISQLCTLLDRIALCDDIGEVHKLTRQRHQIALDAGLTIEVGEQISRRTQ